MLSALRLVGGLCAVGLLVWLSGCAGAHRAGGYAALPSPQDPPPIPARKPATPAAFALSTPETPRTVRFVRGGVPTSYSVAPGDTLQQVARRVGLPQRTLIDANGLTAPYLLRPGQVLRIPRAREHVVAAGDTVFGISKRYGTDMAALIRLNGLAAPDRIARGQRLKIPGSGPAPRPRAVQTATLSTTQVLGVVPAEAVSRAGTAAPMMVKRKPTLTPPQDRAEDTTSGPEEPSEAVAPQVAAAPVKIPPPPARQGSKFLWPVNGTVVSDYGPKPNGLHNDGVNIAAPRGTPIKAAENGVVAYVGNELRGFGNLLLLKHADGWVTAYAHTDEILVQRGDRVTRGQTIARVGSTGNVSQPQLHFEVRKGVRAVDPARLLEARIASAS